MSQANLKSMPALAAYIERIGAEQVHFRKFIKKEHRGNYYLEKASVYLKADGSLSCNSVEFDATKEEKEAIKAEVKAAAASWPKAITVKNIDGLEKVIRAHRKNMKEEEQKEPGILYLFWDNSRKNIIMVQERINKEGGVKDYVPWTKWSDGEWRAMEPDLGLPFWKPPKDRKKSRIMVHEGAKAASFIDGMLHDEDRREEREKHPWTNFLEDYEHWGMIGGALAPHRTVYEELNKEKPTTVIYCCDNDYYGKKALEVVSQKYRRPLSGIKFTDHFPYGFDLADPMPKSLFDAHGKWLGPDIERLICPATWATSKTRVEGTKKPVITLSSHFAQEWVHAVKPEVFIFKDRPNRLLDVKQFNSDVDPFSDISDTSRLVRKDGATKSAIIKYIPSRNFGIYDSDEGPAINTHMPGNVKEKKGDPKPWTDYCEHLVPDEKDRLEFYRWVCTFVARPGVKMNYGMLLISETQGVGKSTLGESILGPIIGMLNMSKPSEKDIVESDYNYWMAHKRLAFCGEIYAGHSSKAYNNLKEIITAKTITIKQKFLADYDLDNWIHIIACSNNMNALKLSADDRRWFIPKVTEVKQTESFWDGFHEWLRSDGLGIIKRWCGEFLKKNKPVGHGENAPMTRQKQLVIEESYSEGQSLVVTTLNQLKEAAEEESFILSHVKPKDANGSWKWDGGLLVLDLHMQSLIKDIVYEGRRNDYLEKPLTIRKTAKGAGWFASEQKVMIDGIQGRLICSNKADAERPPKEVMKEKRVVMIKDVATQWRRM